MDFFNLEEQFALSSLSLILELKKGFWVKKQLLAVYFVVLNPRRYDIDEASQLVVSLNCLSSCT